jgi:hypothetical protein
LGGGKHRAGQLYRPRRTIQQTKADLRLGFYGDAGHGTRIEEPLDISGCWNHVKGKINAWIAKDKGFEADGLSSDLNIFLGMEQWTANAADCLDIKDKENIVTIEAGDLELEDAGSDSDSDSDLADGAE